jgi:Ca-activated chloride channel family protein
MVWFRTIGTFEIVVIILFLVFYGLYLYRAISIARKLSTGYLSVFKKAVIRFSYLVLIIIALLGPSFGESTREVKSIGKDIFICVDVSGSMNAFDIPPTRIERVKFELKNIVEAFNSDRIGLIIFSTDAVVQCPLTYDLSALMMFIETLNTNLLTNAGTDFGPALKLALEKITAEDKSSTQNKSKIIILISDGEDFGESTDNIVNKIHDNDIRLFSLGVGTEKGSRIREGRAYKTNNSGREVLSKLDARTLRAIAIKSGGKYYEISDKNNDVNRLIGSISQIEGEVRDTRMMNVSANKYYYFLLAAFLLIIADALITVKTLRI